MVHMYMRKHAFKGSRLSRKACKGCRRGLWQTASGMTLRAGWTSSTSWTLAHVVPLQATHR